METLPSYMDAVTAVTQIGVLLFTAVLIRESYLLRIRHETPDVLCYLEVANDGTPNMNFVTENVGLATARQIRFRIAGGSDWWEGRGIRLRAEFLERGIPALAPGARIVTTFGNWIQLAQNKTRYSIKIEVSFVGAGRRNFASTSYLDPWIFVGTTLSGNRLQREGIDTLRKIERTLSGWTSPGRLSIRVLNAHQSHVEQEELETWLDEQHTPSKRLTGND
jgi:hypothetical protein